MRRLSESFVTTVFWLSMNTMYGYRINNVYSVINVTLLALFWPHRSNCPNLRSEPHGPAGTSSINYSHACASTTTTTGTAWWRLELDRGRLSVASRHPQ